MYQLEINHLLWSYGENAKEEDKDEGRAEQEKVPLHWAIIPLPGSNSIMPGQRQCSGTPLLRRECCPTETQQPSKVLPFKNLVNLTHRQSKELCTLAHVCMY